jgi:quinol-cytochrome oxidoreductase complex cytochrome b subunit
MKYLNNVLFVNFVSKAVYSYLIKYPTPMNINYLWNFGFMSAIFLVIQIVSGLFLTFFFTPHVDLAFLSVEHIMRDVNYGWLIRYIHANGASFSSSLVYVHILKGIYYGSYYFPRTLVWFTGCIIYILMMGTAFLGYVLPWGQMSYWAATVITNFVTVIPVVGKDIVYWIWGGYSINNATLNRFFSLHYLLPFVIALLSVYHIYQLHKSGSSNELGVRSHYLNKISFYPYFLVKDFFGLFIVLFLFSIFVFFFPEAFNHSDNYIKANPLVTPAHIVPEWYFLPLYGILRSILNKTYGIIIMFVSLLVLFLLPFIDKSLIKNKTFKPFNRSLFWFFSLNFLFLGYLGSQAPVFPYIELGVICSHFHLLYFFLLIPLSVFFESSFFNYFFPSNVSNGSNVSSHKNPSASDKFFDVINPISEILLIITIMYSFYFYDLMTAVRENAEFITSTLYDYDSAEIEIGFRDLKVYTLMNHFFEEVGIEANYYAWILHYLQTEYLRYIPVVIVYVVLFVLP